jgi:superfamily II DNA or RNA helicase
VIPPTLRPDQLALVADYDAQRAAGHRCVIVQAPTGAGKSVVLAHLAARSVAPQDAPGSIVVVSHLGLINEALVGHLTQAGCPAPLLYGHAGDPASPVVVVSAQAIEAGGLHFPNAREVYVDEGHRAAAPSYERFIGAHLPHARVTLLTATPARSDGKALPHATAIVQGPQVSALVAAERLAPITVIAPKEHATTLAADPVDVYPEGRPGFIFAASLPHSIALAEGLRMRRGIRAMHVDGNLHPSKRAEILGFHRDGAIDVITCFRLIAEGVDVPRAEVCMLASSVGSTVTFLQTVGRARRFTPGKRALLLDLCGSMHLHGHPDWDRTYHVDGDAIRAVQPPADQMPVMCKACGAWGLPRSTCEVCGSTRPAPPPPKVKAKDLIEHRAAATDEEAQRARLKLEIDKKLAAGKNPWSALFWFAGVYGEPAKRREGPWAAAYIARSGWRKAS